MKKGIYAILAVLTVFAMVMVSCGGGDSADEFTVTFANGLSTAEQFIDGVTVKGLPDAMTVSDGDKIEKPADPVRSDYEADPEKNPDGIKKFLGWYKDAETEWDFDNDEVTRNVTLTAFWEGGDNILGGDPAPTPPPAQADGKVRFLYSNGTYLDIDYEAGDTTWGDIISTRAYKKKGKDVYKDNTRIFSNWVDQNGTDWTDANTAISANLTLKAKFYQNVVTDDGTALEKLLLENSGLAVYKFDLGSNKLGDYKEFQVTYKISEFALNKNQSRHRVYGEFGTFITKKDTTGATEFDDKNIDGYQTDGNGVNFINAPKFNIGDYILINGGRDIEFNNPDKNIVKNLVGSTEIIADTWFTLKYGLPESANAQSDYTKSGVQYFGLGQTTNAGSRDNNTYAPLWDTPHAAILQLVKDVKLIHKSDATKDIIATIPPADNAQFMAYATPDAMVFCWRGAPGAVVATPPEKPLPPPEYPEAENDFTVNTPALTLYQNDEAKTPDGTKRIVITGNKIVFNLGTGDYNNNGAFGGGGFKIKFADLNLPAIGGVSDYRSYSSIILDCTIAGEDIVGKQVIFSVIDGSNITSVKNNGGSPSEYIGMANGANVFKFDTSALVIGDKDAGFAVRCNNWANNNVPIKGTITVNKITFSLD